MRGWGALMHFSMASGQFRFKWCELYCCIRFSLSQSLLQILKTLGRFMCAQVYKYSVHGIYLLV